MGDGSTREDAIEAHRENREEFPTCNYDYEFLTKLAKEKYPEEYRICYNGQVRSQEQHGWFEYFESNYSSEWKILTEALMKHLGL